MYQDGRPAIDYGHVIETLNKLDAGKLRYIFRNENNLIDCWLGVDEKIVLLSRDEQSMLVVSFRDLKRCLNEAFAELTKQNLKLQ